jgi:protein gp37
MADKTAIEWSDATWNPITGCTKVSAGCKFCYASRDWARLQHLPAYHGRAFTDVATHPERLEQPLRWKRPRKIFVNSMSDLFHEAVPFEFIAAVFGVMASAPHHTFQVLTKRPARMVEFFRWLAARSRGANDRYLNSPSFQRGVRARQSLRDDGKPSLSEPPPPTEMVRGLYDIATPIIERHLDHESRFWRHRHLPECHWRPWPLPNVWLGVSVEDQASADARIPLLLDTPAEVRWISAEPLLGPIHLAEHGLHGGPGQLDWVVVGGESGPNARPSHPSWVRSLRDQCTAAGASLLFKQWGEWIDDENIDGANLRAPQIADPNEYFREHDWRDGLSSWRVGKKAAGRFLDGSLHDAYPR